MKSQTSIFISHAWGGTSDEILAQLVKRLEAENIMFILDKRDLAYRQSIRDFMVQLGDADMVIIILSNKYLKSEYCMFELLEIHKNENLTERIFPIVLDEVKISSSSDRLEFVKYWETQLMDLQNKVKELNSLSYIEGITEDLNLYSEIRNNIARLTGILRDINTLNIKLHQDSDYHDLVQAIKSRIKGHQGAAERSEEAARNNATSTGAVNVKRIAIALFALFGLFMAWGIVTKSNLFASNDQQQPANGEKPDTTQMASSTLPSPTKKDSSVATPAMLKEDKLSQKQNTEFENQPGVTEKKKTLLSNPSVTAKTSSRATQQDSKPSGRNTSPILSDPPKEEKPVLKNTIRKAIIPKETELWAKSSTTISSDDGFATPKRITFLLNKPVMDGNTIALPIGSVIIASLTNLKPSNNKRSGMIDFVFEYLQAPDGQKIPLHTDEFHLVAKGDIPMMITTQAIYKIKTSSTLQIEY